MKTLRLFSEGGGGSIPRAHLSGAWAGSSTPRASLPRATAPPQAESHRNAAKPPCAFFLAQGPQPSQCEPPASGCRTAGAERLPHRRRRAAAAPQVPSSCRTAGAERLPHRRCRAAAAPQVPSGCRTAGAEQLPHRRCRAAAALRAQSNSDRLFPAGMLHTRSAKEDQS